MAVVCALCLVLGSWRRDLNVHGYKYFTASLCNYPAHKSVGYFFIEETLPSDSRYIIVIST